MDRATDSGVLGEAARLVALLSYNDSPSAALQGQPGKARANVPMEIAPDELTLERALESIQTPNDDRGARRRPGQRSTGDLPRGAVRSLRPGGRGCGTAKGKPKTASPLASMSLEKVDPRRSPAGVGAARAWSARHRATRKQARRRQWARPRRRYNRHHPAVHADRRATTGRDLRGRPQARPLVTAGRPPNVRGRNSSRLVMLALPPVARITNSPCPSAYRSEDSSAFR